MCLFCSICHSQGVQGWRRPWWPSWPPGAFHHQQQSCEWVEWCVIQSIHTRGGEAQTDCGSDTGFEGCNGQDACCYSPRTEQAKAIFGISLQPFGIGDSSQADCPFRVHGAQCRLWKGCKGQGISGKVEDRRHNAAQDYSSTCRDSPTRALFTDTRGVRQPKCIANIRCLLRTFKKVWPLMNDSFSWCFGS